MRPSRLSPRTAGDLEEIGDYIARDNPARAVSFVEELREACKRLPESPESHPTRSEFGAGLRVAIYRRYMIFFRVLPNEVRVERILHGARDLPRTLKE